MQTIKIYKTECTRGFLVDETGRGFSLTPWGANTSVYEGDDDGGKDYILPDGYELAGTNSGEKMIFRGDQPCTLLAHSSGRPQIVGPSLSEMPVLALA